MVQSIFELAGVKPQEDEKKSKGVPSLSGQSQTPISDYRKPAVTSIYEYAHNYTRAEEDVRYTNDDILNDPQKLETLRKYMMHRKGDYYKKAAPEEVLDDFVDHMRWVSTNEVSTFGEARQVFSLEDSEKPIYRDAFQLFEKLDSPYRAGGISELGDAISTHVQAAITAPSSWMGGFIGRGLAKPVTKGVTKAMEKVLLKKVVEEGADIATKKAVIKSAAAAAEKTAIKTSGIIAAKKSRKELVTAAILGTAVDGLLSYDQERNRQRTLVEVGAQEEIDRTSVMLNALFGVVGGGIAYFPDAMRGTVKLTKAKDKIDLANKLRSKEAKKVVAKELEDSIKKLATDWDEIAKKGQILDAKSAIRERSIDWFFDINDERSFVRIFQRLGVDLGADDKTFSHKMVEFVRGLPAQQRGSITKALKPFGITFGEMVDVFAASLKEGGTNLSKASQAKAFYQSFKNTTVTKKKAIDELVTGEQELEKAAKEVADPQVLRYVTSVWKRLLTSHPGTTMLNVKGWVVTASARALSEILHGGVLGSVGLAKKLMGKGAADKTLAKSSAMFKSQGILLKSILDPYTAIEGFTELLNNAPKKHREAFMSSFYGGVGAEGPAAFKINPANKAVKAIESTVDTATKLALVKTQDLFTKCFSGLKELDKISRIELGKGVEELLATGKTHLITDEMWDRAARVMLEDTFSANYTRGGFRFQEIAHLIEKASNAPGFGFIFPFGRFVNNTIAFTYNYSPLAFLPITKYQKGLDLEERLMKAAVGTTAIVMATAREIQKQAEGLQWNEERTSTGDIRDVSGMFPVSLYNLFGRLIANWKNGGGISEALWADLEKQLGPLSSLDKLTSGNPITDLIKGSKDARETQGDSSFQEVAELVLGMLFSGSASIAAGFTRPLDPINDVMGTFLDIDGVVNDVALDRKQGEGIDKTIQNFTRYTNTLFNLLLGEQTEDGLLYGKGKNTAVERDTLKDPNPISRTLGSPLKPRQDSIDILLGQLDLAPFRFDSFTTGVPEFDDFVNDSIFPILERKAEALLDSEFYQSRPLAVKRTMAMKMLQDARKEVLERLEEGTLGDSEDYRASALRTFLSSNPQAYRAEAKIALGIDKEDKDLTLEEIEQLTLWIEINEELDKDFLKQK